MLLMRVIETLMNDAILNHIDWKKDNTEVVYNKHSGNSHVYLYGEEIAIVGEHFVKIFDGKRKSQTTRSRLNAILSEHGVPGDCVFQRAGKWFLIDDKQEEVFENGYIFA
jgi:hypothetical protein